MPVAIALAQRGVELRGGRQLARLVRLQEFEQLEDIGLGKQAHFDLVGRVGCAIEADDYVLGGPRGPRGRVAQQ
jgi:hypothetical protein